MASQPARFTPGSVVSLKGYILQAKELPGLSARQLEHRLGYRDGRFAHGWYWLVLLERPGEAEFKIMGNTLYPGGVPANEAQDFDTIGRRLVPDYSAMKASYATGWPLQGAYRWMKAIPYIGHSDGEKYPEGTGALQIELTELKRFRVIRRVTPSETLDASSAEWESALTMRA
jgi:hypothetical protein